MADAPAVRVDEVTQRFDKTLALDGCRWICIAARSSGSSGPNGAGKTTLIRTILDLIRPDRGRVEVLMYGKRPTLPELWRWLRAA